jgi:hypothetical protein
MPIYSRKQIHIHNKKSKRLNKNIGGEIKKCDRAYKNALGTCWAVAAQTVFTFGDLTYRDLEIVMTSFNLETKNQFINHRIEEVKQLNELNSLFINYILNDEKIVYIKNVLNKFIDRYYSKVLEKQNTEKPQVAIDPTLNPERCELVISQNFKKIFDYPILTLTAF